MLDHEKKKADDFLDLVARMRAAQIEFHKYRMKSFFDRMRVLERQVDSIVKESIRVKQSKQGQIF